MATCEPQWHGHEWWGPRLQRLLIEAPAGEWRRIRLFKTRRSAQSRAYQLRQDPKHTGFQFRGKGRWVQARWV